MPGDLFVVAAPSGAGKTSLVRALIERHPEVGVTISHTTRTPRAHEVDGVNYHFVSPTAFSAMNDAGEFLESAVVFGNRYGTSRAEVERILGTGHHIVLEIDWQGAAQVCTLRPDAISVFILPPSREVLLRRLTGRGQDSQESIEKRSAAAVEEMSHCSDFNYVVVNDDFDVALDTLAAIVIDRDPRLKREAQIAQLTPLLDQLLDPMG
ncbi:MAG: guanylate kinase [Gammaproteobacteria bacterium]|uniref:Guanylate kinase n=1 Tax=OM182 bacterium MED-G24 TaxID=1986255 RepID=A0A2A5X042_9GAMM|nr:guanylate kinase [Gammaproteobacteria bacterium]PDH42160.1 MAG: guanylate kinase [OM182 bacterium MED-G24]RPG23232.1 MAG: guanylate kinase [Gammaproteobacteria bacterium TMED50]|tara:strand:- start:249 stop:875 length:627 start_codon:yes stop_codon:yes gene_type:complete